MAKKDDNIILECMGGLKSLIRHRKGLKVFGKELKDFKLGKLMVHLDNEIPGIIQDVIENLNLKNKDNQLPMIINKRRTEYGWYLVIKLVPGFEYLDIKKHERHFADLTNSFVKISWLRGNVHMEIQTNSLPEMIPYSWDSTLYKNLQLAIPIGYTQRGLEVFDLCESPHMLISGQTGFGKSMAIHCIVSSIIDKAQICICDPKRVDFRYLQKGALLARDDTEICNLLKLLNKESDKRLLEIEEDEDVCVTKIQELKNPPPLIVVVVEEMGELSKEAMELTNRIGRLSRAAGIHLIGATQYPYTDVIPSTTRNLFEARLCFRVASEASSRVVLGEDGSMAAWLPAIKGRAIWKFGHEFKEVQTMFLDKEARRKIHEELEPRGWQLSEEGTTKRLKPN